MASPPEVHSMLLSAGPGPGPLLAAAGAWSSLSAEYAASAAELTAVLGAVQAGAWQGPSAQAYSAAHLPYLAWLDRAAADSAVAAAGHQAVAAAYAGALTAMPTLAELAANHAMHGVLVATNFFGVNTISIAVNEADYARMWVQAATVMQTYQAISDATRASLPHPGAVVPVLRSGSAADPSTPRNPLQGMLDFLDPILKSLGIEDGTVAHDPTVSNWLTTLVADFLRNFGVNWNPAAGTLNGQVYDYYSNAAQPIWYLARGLELFENLLTVTQDPTQLVRALQYIAALALFDWPTHVMQFVSTLSQSPALMAAAMGAALAPAGSLAGLAGLAGLTGAPTAPVPPVPAVVPPAVLPVAVGAGPGVIAPPAPPPPAPPPATMSPAAGVPPTPPAPAAPAFAFPYAVGGGPGTRFGPGLGAGLGAGAGSEAKRKTPTAEVAAAAAEERAQARKRRRRRSAKHEHHDAFVTANVGVDPDWGPSQRGMGPGGFAGAVHRDTAGAPTGLIRLSDNGFRESPRVPLLPDTWADDG
ncbi:PPE family protein [Mycobacterium sp. M1]|uniref:PPE family protein n=1 Tax=Mycolicibacter acidiphilus TaxID=2835306 RepID=A0ABS5RD81_9MYCO|nr:PPE family protein [Mycolicibacter acidiphilus]MBS9532240.1 PPE family protein [Mycolicibacter acidiphilus]